MPHKKMLSMLMILSALVCFTACAQEATRTVPGQEVELFGGQVLSWAKVDAEGQVLEAGITLPLSVLENAPAAPHRHEFAADAVIDFPAVVQQSTFLNHASLFWEAHGHFPEGRYGAPHWDFHFFTIPATVAEGIDCSDLSQGNPEAVSAGWLPPVPPNAEAADFCVPLMGFHSLPITEFKAPGEFQDGLFDQVMLGGYYGGAFIFVEPMITQEVLLRKESISMSMPVPARLGYATHYPRTFDLIYVKAENAYQLVFSTFETID